MNDKTKAIQYALIGVALIVALLGSFFGVKLPAPVIPEPTAAGVSETAVTRGLVGNEFESLIVTKQLSSKGVVLDNFVFEGATADTYETTLAITDPTADRTITVPNSSGTLALNPYGGSIEFEGTTADDFETTLAVADPTVIDKTVTIPNETGAVMLSSLTTNATDAANSVTGASNALVFEGSGVDGFELSLSAANPGADVTLTLPAETAAVMVSSLTTNATDAANSVTGASNALKFEGSAADGNETSITATNPTAARTVTLADASGTVMLSSLATNGPDAANAVWGGTNSLIFEGATGGADTYETTLTPTDPTADRTVTLQDATGTVALTTQGVDMTLTAVADGGNAGAKNEFIGLPRIKLIGLGQGTNPASQSISLADDSPDGDFAPVDASVTEAAEAAIYKFGAASYKATWAADSAENDGFVDAALFGNASLEDQESAGLWLYTTVALASGDLQIVITDDGAARKFAIGAVAANVWTWVEVDISSLAGGTGDVCSDFAITMTAQGAAAATLDSGFITYFDTGWVWDAPDEEALGVAIQQDGVLGVIDTESGATLAEGTDWFVHYESGADFIVWVTNQSGADAAVLVAY